MDRYCSAVLFLDVTVNFFGSEDLCSGRHPVNLRPLLYNPPPYNAFFTYMSHPHQIAGVVGAF